TAVVPLAKSQKSSNGPGRAREDLSNPGRYHHSVLDDPALVPVLVPGSARRRDWTRVPVQPRWYHRAGARNSPGADRFQLADLDRPNTRIGGARGRSWSVGDGLRIVRNRGGCGGSTDTDDRARLVPGDGIFPARLVRICAAVHF